VGLVWVPSLSILIYGIYYQYLFKVYTVWGGFASFHHSSSPILLFTPHPCIMPLQNARSWWSSQSILYPCIYNTQILTLSSFWWLYSSLIYEDYFSVLNFNLNTSVCTIISFYQYCKSYLIANRLINIYIYIL